MKTVNEIKAEYKANNTYTNDILDHGKKQRQLPEIKAIDERLQSLGYNLDDRFFHQLAVLDDEVVKIIDSTRGLRVFSLDTDEEYLIDYVKDYLDTKELAKFVVEHTTNSYAPKLKLR